MSKAKYDPLEAAKLTAESATAAPKAAAPVPQAAPPSAAKSPSPPSSPAAGAAPIKVRYVVRETKRVSVNGQLNNWQAGRVLDPSGYGGEAGIEKLRSQGVILDRVEE